MRIPANYASNPQDHPTVRVHASFPQPVEDLGEGQPAPESEDGGWPSSHAHEQEWPSQQADDHVWPTSQPEDVDLSPRPADPQPRSPASSQVSQKSQSPRSPQSPQAPQTPQSPPQSSPSSPSQAGSPPAPLSERPQFVRSQAPAQSPPQSLQFHSEPQAGPVPQPDRTIPAAGRQAWPVRIEPRPDGTSEQQAVSTASTASAASPAPPASAASTASTAESGESGQAGPPAAGTSVEEIPPGATPPTGGSEGEDPAPRPRRRPLVIAAVLVAVLLVVGGTLAVPDVSNRLGLPWAPNAPKGDPPAPQDVALALGEPPESAPSPTPSGVAAAIDDLASDPALGTLIGSVVDPATGTALWERNAAQALPPASTTKLLTSAAALLALDHDMRFPTRVVEGSEPGTVVLVGGGDVTLSSLPRGEESIFPGAAHLDDLVDQVREATGGDVSRVELDLSAFTGPTEGRGWASEDVPSTYMVQTQPAMLDGGRTDPTNGHSMGRADPAGHLAEVFAQRLGAEVGGETTAPEGAKVLGEVWSPPVDELVRVSLVESDNLLSEVLARQVAIAEGKQPSFEGGVEAMLEVLSRHGIDVGGVRLNDGSGLSPLNEISPTTLTQLLVLAASPDNGNEVTVKLRPMLVGLPVAGGSGTLTARYDHDTATQGRGWVRAKTGSIPAERVHTLAGVVLTEDERVLVFALMSNGGEAEPARAALDRIAAQLRGCGCR